MNKSSVVILCPREFKFKDHEASVESPFLTDVAKVQTVWLDYNEPFPTQVLDTDALILWHGPLIDAATVGCLLQLVLWPLRLATPWTVERTVLIDLCALSSLIAVAGVVAAASCSTRTSVRSLAMVACLLFASGARWPLAAAGVPDVALALPFLGACATILDLTDATASMPDSEVWNHARFAALFSVTLGGTGFLLASIISAVQGRRPHGERGGVATLRRVG